MSTVAMAEPKVTETSGGIGINWSAHLRRDDLPDVVVTVDGTSSGRMRYATWYVAVEITVPENRNRQPKPHTGLWGDTHPDPNMRGKMWSNRIKYVSRQLGRYSNKQEAVDAAYKALHEMDGEALLDDIIETMWAGEYASDCNSYLGFGSDDKTKREARIEKIRALRKIDAKFAELFPEPPNKSDY